MTVRHEPAPAHKPARAHEPAWAHHPAPEPPRPRRPHPARKKVPALTPPEHPLCRSTLGHHTDIPANDPALKDLQQLWDDTAEEARRHARRLRMLARWWPEGAEPGTKKELAARDLASVQLAQALRTTTDVAHGMLADAHRATTGLPLLMARLESGEMPVRWFTAVLRRSGSLPVEVLPELDEQIGAWPLAIQESRFRRRMAALVRWFLDRERARETAPPERTVFITPPDEDGMACLEIRGPAPEILALGQRLDAAARAVQRAQRHALEHAETDGVPLEAPFDDGTVGPTGSAMPLAALRYAILTRSVLATGGVEVPAERFRLNVTVPALTLLGAADAPGLLDGLHPIPADMARSLAATASVWHRILTDPATGAFLPLPAQRYQATPEMLEHLRLRNPECAVPGCRRCVRSAAEMDHIEEFRHGRAGGEGDTSIENTHLLCWQHHRLKTEGLLDPVRLADCEPLPPDPWGPPDPPEHLAGVTQWQLSHHHRVSVEDEDDLVTPLLVEEFQRALGAMEERIAVAGSLGPPPF